MRFLRVLMPWFMPWKTPAPIRLGIVLGLLLLASSTAPAQFEYASWVYGDSIGVTFGNQLTGLRPNPTLQGRPPISTMEGTATYSDPCSGALLWYTEGLAVYDRYGNTLPDGTGLFGGTSSTQGAIFVPDPGDEDRVYLIICPDRTGGTLSNVVRYSYTVLSKRTNNGLGGIVQKNVLFGPELGTERITVTHMADGSGYWLAIVADLERSIWVYPITEAGIGPDPLVYTIPDHEQVMEGNSGALKFSPDGRYLGSTSGNLYQFDNRNGKLSWLLWLEFPEELSSEPPPSPDGLVDGYYGWYGLSFSPTSDFVYLSCSIFRFRNFGITPAHIYQYDLRGAGPHTIRCYGQRVATINNVSWYWAPSLQLAPNGKIYFSDSLHLNVIDAPDNVGQACQILHQVVTYDSGRANDGLPSCIESSFRRGALFPCLTVNVTSDTICANSCATITVSLSANVDDLQVGVDDDPWVSYHVSQSSVSLCTLATGTHRVRVRAYVGSRFVTDSILLFVRPTVDVVAGPDHALCDMTSTQLTASGAQTYRWVPTDGLDDPTSPTPIVQLLSGARSYVVTGTDTNGCTGTDTVLVVTASQDIWITPDTTICEGSTATITITGVPVRWIAGLDSTAAPQVVVRPTTTTTYVATVGLEPCLETVRCVVTVLPRPPLTISADTTICEGEIAFLSVETDGSVQWESNGPIDDDTARTIAVQPRQSAWFSVTSTSPDGCVIRDSVRVSVTPRVARAMSDTAICAGTSIRLDYTGPAGGQWFRIGDAIAVGGDGTVVPSSTTSYELVVADGSCLFRDTVTVTILAIPTSNIRDTIICTGSGVVLPRPWGRDAVWYDSLGLPIGGSETTVYPTSATTYVGRYTTADGCSAEDTINVSVVPPARLHFVAPLVMASPGERVSIPITFNAWNLPGTTVRVRTTVQPTVMLIDAEDTLRSVELVDGSATFTLGGLILLSPDVEGSLTVELVSDQPPCTTVSQAPGSVSIGGCAMLRRQMFTLLDRAIFILSNSGGMATITVEQDPRQTTTITPWTTTGRSLPTMEFIGPGSATFDAGADRRLFLGITAFGRTEVWPILLPP